MIYLAMIFLVSAAVSGAAIASRRRAGTPRHWRDQVPTLILLAIAVALFIVAGTT